MLLFMVTRKWSLRPIAIPLEETTARLYFATAVVKATPRRMRNVEFLTASQRVGLSQRTNLSKTGG